MLIDASTKPSQSEQRKILLYGDTGVGKTHCLQTLPSHCFPALLLDTDLGSRTIREAFEPGQVFIAQMDKLKKKGVPAAFEQTTAVLRDAEKQDPPFKTYIIDSLTTFYMRLLEYVLYQAGKAIDTQPSQPDYGNALRVTTAFLSDFIDSGKHVICIAHEQVPEAETGKGSLALTGQLRSLVPRLFDEIIHCTTMGSGEKIKYIWYTKAHGMYLARTRMELPPKIEPNLAQLFEGEA